MYTDNETIVKAFNQVHEAIGGKLVVDDNSYEKENGINVYMNCKIYMPGNRFNYFISADDNGVEGREDYWDECVLYKFTGIIDDPFADPVPPICFSPTDRYFDIVERYRQEVCDNFGDKYYPNPPFGPTMFFRTAMIKGGSTDHPDLDKAAQDLIKYWEEVYTVSCTIWEKYKTEFYSEV